MQDGEAPSICILLLLLFAFNELIEVHCAHHMISWNGWIVEASKIIKTHVLSRSRHFGGPRGAQNSSPQSDLGQSLAPQFCELVSTLAFAQPLLDSICSARFPWVTPFEKGASLLVAFDVSPGLGQIKYLQGCPAQARDISLSALLTSVSYSLQNLSDLT